ncbi:acylneuraminate cytidylyltransferase family protein [Ruminococcaceae bacterium OttesenSCG-928-N02]|nr:acylneuraminate cytidylyltransferase family protein [Ruminococcaceae bacterium OttesenSCG-928-N02]
MKRVLLTICGRAGSKGFKNKNLKTFCGAPLVYYTLSAAEMFIKERADLQVDICLNTDSQPLAELVLAKYPEVQVVQRPQELAGDTVAKMAVFQHSLSQMEARFGCRYDYHIDMDITSPMRQSFDLPGIVKMFEEEEGLDLVMSAAPSRRNPYFNMGQEDEKGYARRIIQNNNTARQQAPKCYDINASLYVFARDFLTSNKSADLWQGKVKIYEMFDTGILDIDSEEDFLLLGAIAQHLYNTVPTFQAVQANIRM